MRVLVRARCRALREPQLARLSFVQRRYLRKLHPGDQRSKYDKKIEAAAEDWQHRADAIRNGERESMLSVLEARGYVNAITGDRNKLDKELTEDRIGAYVGVDPTAASIHLGHLLPMMALLWMFVHGYEVVVLIGGSTAAIGDPTGRTSSREPMPTATRRANIYSMQAQLKRLWAKMENYAIERHGHERDWSWRRNLWNNSEWFNKVTVHEFMSQLGNGTRLGPLLGRDTIKNKMEKGDGVSFSELAYPLLQAWDWWHMFKAKGVSMQIGGADQFGNIIAGIDSLNHLRKNAQNFAPDLAPEYKDRTFYGLTVPLLSTSAGEKFGKSVGNAIWLDEDLTSPLELYQFLLRSADADIERYLRLFTLLPLDAISSLMKEHDEDRSRRIPQRRLANELVTMIHGEGKCQEVEAGLEMLYSGHRSAAPSSATNLTGNSGLDGKQQHITAENAGGTRIFLPRSAVYNKPFASILQAVGFAETKSEANRLIVAGGAYVGSQPGMKGGHMGALGDSLKFLQIMTWPPAETERFVVDDKLLIVRKGKWKVKIVELIPDSEFVRRGLPSPPGWSTAETVPTDETQAEASAS